MCKRMCIRVCICACVCVPETERERGEGERERQRRSVLQEGTELVIWQTRTWMASGRPVWVLQPSGSELMRVWREEMVTGEEAEISFMMNAIFPDLTDSELGARDGAKAWEIWARTQGPPPHMVLQRLSWGATGKGRNRFAYSACIHEFM